jgi:hypothetical protein
VVLSLGWVRRGWVEDRFVGWLVGWLVAGQWGEQTEAAGSLLRLLRTTWSFGRAEGLKGGRHDARQLMTEDG